MIYNFRAVEFDNEEQFVIDTDPEVLTWARTSSIISAPSVVAAGQNLVNFVPIEQGKLNSLGGGRYTLEGRQPFSKDGKPQLSIIVILSVLSGDNEGTNYIFLQANVPTSEFQHQEIKHFQTQCLQALPIQPAGVGKLHVAELPQK